MMQFCRYFILLASLILGISNAQSQTYLSAKIVNSHAIPLAGAHVQMEGSGLGTVANEDGFFSIIPSSADKRIRVSFLGYRTEFVSIDSIFKTKNNLIVLNESVTLLDNVNVYPGGFGEHILKLATERGSINYTQLPFSLKGFYRQLIRQDSNYVRLSDAFIEVYQPKYDVEKGERRVKLVQARKSSDDGLDLDYFSPPSLILNHIRSIGFGESFFEGHELEISESTYNDSEVFLIKAIPKTGELSFLYETTFYVNKEDYAIIGYEARLPERNKLRLPVQSVNLKFNGKRMKVTARKIYENGGIMCFRWEGKWFLRTISNEAKFEVLDSKGKLLTIITDKSSILFYDLRIGEVTGSGFSENHVNYCKEFVPTLPYEESFWNDNNVLKYSTLEEKVRQDLEKKASLTQQYQRKE